MRIYRCKTYGSCQDNNLGSLASIFLLEELFSYEGADVTDTGDGKSAERHLDDLIKLVDMEVK